MTSKQTAAERALMLSRGYSLIELLVAIGIIAVLVALVFPAISGTRSASLELKALSDVRQHGLMLTQYSTTNHDRPPVWFKPQVGRPGEHDQEYMHEEVRVRGSWWSNGDYFFLAFDPPASPSTLMAPKSPMMPVVSYNGGRSTPRSSYRLAKCFYGDPGLYNRGTRGGLEQWRVQRFTDVAFPSAKGMMWLMSIWHIPSLGPGYPACCADQTVRTAVLWADLSSSAEAMAQMRPGVANPYDSAYASPVTAWQPGIPIDETEDGIRGRDR